MRDAFLPAINGGVSQLYFNKLGALANLILSRKGLLRSRMGSTQITTQLGLSPQGAPLASPFSE